MAQHTLKILWRKHRKIFKVCLVGHFSTVWKKGLNFPDFSGQRSIWAFLRFRVIERHEKYHIIRVTQSIIQTRCVIFYYCTCMNTQHRILRSLILVSLFHLPVYLTFFSYRDLIDRINSYFRRNTWWGTCFLLAPNIHRPEAVVRRCSVKVFLKISQYSQENTSFGVSL